MSDLEPIERAAFLNELRALLRESEPLRSREAIDGFIGVVNARVAKGAQEYGDASPKLPFTELLSEMQQEAADIAGWACQAWRRVNRLSSACTLDKLHPLVQLSGMLLQSAEDAFHLWAEMRWARAGLAVEADKNV